MSFDPNAYLNGSADTFSPAAFLGESAPRDVKDNDHRIAIVGMAGRFPGARTVEEFWENLRAGRESITFFPESEIELPPWAHTDTRDPKYVRAAGILDDADRFDAELFGCSPREADYMDPQQRVFLECCWSALEHAGYNPRATGQVTGVFAGTVYSTYLWMMLGEGVLGNPAERMLATIGNLEDNLTTRVAYKLNLNGPAVTVQTACSSSLVAVHMACENLLAGKCKMALAGGVAIVFPQKTGYLHNPDLIDSRDGHCRAFSKGSTGTIFSNGAGVVVLKRLSDAIADGNTIHAVILGSAVNNDGNDKIGYTAPSVSGQSKVIRDALTAANASPDSISYIEAHGTGTALGDPIEIAALAEVFRPASLPRKSCPIGSVKTNIGHLNTAAGVAGLIKLVLALKHHELPPSLHFSEPNPDLHLEDTPFFVNTQLQPWNAAASPRRAGLSSFGIGGTNAHAILEEAPVPGATVARKWELVPLSGRSKEELAARIKELHAWLTVPGQNVSLSDIAFTLALGRTHFSHRAVFVASSIQDLTAQLAAPRDAAIATQPSTPTPLLEAASAYQAGGDLKWNVLFPQGSGKRIALPGTIFHRKKHWFRARKQKAAAPAEHPWLEIAAENSSEYRKRFLIAERVLNDHKVRGRPLLPGVAQIEFARAAAEKFNGGDISLIQDIHWLRPLEVTGVEAEAFVRLARAPGGCLFEIGTRAGATETIHSTGLAVQTPPAKKAWPRFEFESFQKGATRVIERAALYPQFSARGIEYGPSFQGVARIWCRENTVLAEIELPAGLRQEWAELSLHPGLLDGILQSTAGLFNSEEFDSGRLFLPWSIGELRILSPLPARVFAYSRIRTFKSEDDFRRFDIDVYNEAGEICLQIVDLCSKEITAPTRSKESTEESASPISPEKHQSILEQRIRFHIASTLNVSEDDIDVAQSHSEHGVDSILAVEIVKSLNDELGVNLRATDLFSYSTVRQLAAHLAGIVPAAIAAEPVRNSEPLPAPQPSAEHPRTSQEPIAVIGMSGQFPGAENPDQFWQNLMDRVDSVTTPPTGRWPEIANRHSFRAGFLPAIDTFDPLFFSISPKEAECMDPQQRLFLQEAWKALEDAGCTAEQLNAQKCGVFVGVGPSDYADRVVASDECSAFAFTGNATSILSARIAYFLNLKGPAISVDTACSSSLVAVHLACQSLRAGECGLAIAGGVHVMSTPRIHSLSAKAGMLSPLGRCHAFDAAADGMVLGEGVGAVVLKPLSAAIADGDAIYGILRASGLNQDGKTNGITAPSSVSQTALELSVYEQAGIDPQTISYIEAHGTGTKLGDPIELNALADAFRKTTSRTRFCGIGSVKTNIGHLMTAAGIASLIKTLLCLKHRRIPASLHFERPNEHFDFARSPFYVTNGVQGWFAPAGAPLRAAVSSFGFSGTNAHVVVEEPALFERKTSSNFPAHLLAISAADENALRERVQNLIDWIRANEKETSIDELAWTLNCRRTHLPVRAAVIASNLEEALGEFQILLGQDAIRAPGPDPSNASAPAHSIIQRIVSSSHTPDRWNKDLQELARIFVSGGEIEWRQLYGSQKRIPLRLPAYPFARERCWIDLPAASGPTPETAIASEGAKTGENWFYVPAWKLQPAPEHRNGLGSMGRGSVLIFRTHADAGLSAALLRQHETQETATIYLGRHFEQIGPGTLSIDSRSSADWERLAAQFPRVAQFYFLSTCLSPATAISVDELQRTQDCGASAFLRLAQAFRFQDRQGPPLPVRIITFNLHRAGSDDTGTSPWFASLVGAAKAIHRECPGIALSAIDLSCDEINSANIDTIAKAISHETAPLKLGQVALRSGKRYIQKLEPVSLGIPAAPAYRKGGTFLIAGGAGGIAFELSRRLASHARARLVLLGRRPLDSEIQTKIAAIQALGGDAIYCQSDLTDSAAVARAVAQGKARFGPIHGAIHSAIVLKDAAFWKLTDADLQAALDPKVLGSFNLANCLAGEPLDFFAFFSSACSLFGNPGQANYVAGCAFKDAFAEYLGARLTCPVRVINWGYWGETGIVADATHRKRLGKSGILPISTPEGLDALERILAADFPQIAAIKLTPAAQRELGLEQAGRFENPREGLKFLEDAALHSAFKTLRELEMPLQLSEANAFAQNSPIAPSQRRLAAALVQRFSEANLFSNPDAHSPRLAELRERFPALKPYVDLLEPCLKRLAAVLTGTERGTDVLFPGGDHSLVERVYADNEIAQAANQALAAAVRSFVASHPQRTEPIRILEIGAGTGSATAAILSELRGAKVDYLYTDVSPAFLKHGQQKFSSYDFVRFGIFDLDQELAAQSSEQGFDLVIASNVLHATSSVRTSLARIHRLLKPGGILLANELTAAGDFLLCTFGLTPGWWAFTDPQLRIPNSPLLSIPLWEAVFRERDFAPEVVAASDVGWSVFRAVRQESRKTNTISDSPANPGSKTSEALSSYLARAFGEVLKLTGSGLARLTPKASFDQFGIDSLVTLELIARLEKDFGKLPKTLLFEHRNLESLGAYLGKNHPDVVAKLCGAELASRPPAATPAIHERAISHTAPTATPLAAPPRPATGLDVAIIGLSGRYPKARNLDEFWKNLVEGCECVSELPADRWPQSALETPAADGIYTRRGAFLDDIAAFDPLFFNISPREAELMDPQERLFLEMAWHAMEDAGYTRERLSFPEKTGERRKVGVFAGVMYGTYQLYGAEEWTRGKYVNTSSGYWCIPNRVSWILDLQGPSLAIDTACSSSLTAIHLACESLRAGECAMAFAGGVNLILHPSRYAQLCQVKMLSPDGVCRPFGEGANGFVDGEGVGVVLLKPLADALRDGDRIYGVIKGSALNSGGKTNGFTVPNPGAQAELVRSAWQRSGLQPDRLGYVEAHGTGTSLGDPIEIAGLTTAFEGSGLRKCAIGSIKSNIGHLEAAAGIAALTKVLLMFRHGKLAPSLHAEMLNSYIDFSKTPFQLQQKAEDWPSSELPRCAAISSFGAGGANAHLVLEESPSFESSASGVPESNPEMIVLSARKTPQLIEAAGHLRDFAASHEDFSLADLAFTLQTGREHFEERLAFLAGNRQELVTRLDSWLAAPDTADAVCRGSNSRHPHSGVSLGDNPADRAYVRALFTEGQLARILSFWAFGSEIHWHDLPRLRQPNRISLPGYPFARERYWIPLSSGPASLSEKRQSLHPLLDENCSTLSETKFSREFRAEDPILRDHRVNQQPVLPGVAHLEMARAAAVLAGVTPVSGLSGVVWMRPILAADQPAPIQVSITSQASRLQFEIWSNSSGEKVVHSKGRIETAGPSSFETALNLEDLRRSSTGTISADELYARFAAGGLLYGPGFQAVQEIWRGDRAGLARLRRPAGWPDDDRFGWPPSLLDGALQSIVAVIGDAESGELHLPFSLGRLTTFAALPPDCFAVIEPLVATNGESSLRKFNVHITDAQGNILMRLEQCAFRAFRLSPKQVAAAEAPSVSPLGQLLQRVEQGDITWQEAVECVVTETSTENGVAISRS